jgi:hypothetical protein
MLPYADVNGTCGYVQAVRSGVAVEMVGPEGISCPMPSFLLANLHRQLLLQKELAAAS